MLRAVLTTMLITGVAAACTTTRSDTEVDTTADIPEPALQDTVLEEDLAPLPSWGVLLAANEGFAITGQGEVRALTDGTRAMVEIDDAEANAQHPWHVHSGDCGSNGPIVGDPAAYPVLSVDANGEASAEATIDVVLDADADYYVNIHKSPTETETIVSCGELTGTGTF